MSRCASAIARSAMDDVALVLLVHEKPGISPTGEPPSVLRRLRSRLMFFPILDYEDGYGWTYGARTTVVDIAGKGDARLGAAVVGRHAPRDHRSRSHVPGRPAHPPRRDRSASRSARTRTTRSTIAAPSSRRAASGGCSTRSRLGRRRRGPNVDVRAAARRTSGLAAPTSRSTRAAIRRSRLTRSSPRRLARLNAIGTTSTSWASPAIDRYRLDARGYKRLFAQNVVAVRAQYDTASDVLPPYEQLLLGGATLRGIAAGKFAGDTRLLWSAELRVPFTSPLSAGRIGFNGFMDGGRIGRARRSAGRRRTYRSAGAGVFLISPVFQLNLDVAHSLDGHGTRVHFGTGFSF